MTTNYPYNLHDGHLIVEFDELRTLVDTGAPTSVSEHTSINVADTTYNANATYLGVTTKTLSENIGCPIDALLGADILNRYDVALDPTTSTMTLNDLEIPLPGTVMPLDLFQGIPIVTAQIGGQDTRLFFDTGAKLSYLDADLVMPYPTTSSTTDFYPGIGTFETDLRSVPIELGEADVSLSTGQLPDMLALALQMANVSGILGTEILDHFRVYYAPRRKKWALERLSN